MYSLSLQQILFHAVAGLAIASLLGWTMAAVASALGDEGPAQDGRLTLNPLAHLGAVGFVAFLLFGMGWIRPMDVRPADLRGSRWRTILVPGSGIVALGALGLAASGAESLALRILAGEAAFAVAALMSAVVTSSLSTALLNVLPIPPLANGLVLRAFAPDPARAAEQRAGWIGALVLVALWLGVFSTPINAVLRALRRSLGV